MVAVSYTATGRAAIVDLIDNTAATPSFWFGWGTGGSSTGATATTTDTALAVEATESRILTTNSQPTAVTNQFVATITAGTGKTIEEYGLFTASTSGSIIIRASQGGVVLATGDSIEATFQLAQTAGT